MTEISFIVCSHRAPPSLDDAIESIAEQAGSQSVEVVLVNNGFPSERARRIVEQCSPSGLSIRIVDESRPGLGFARRAGFAAAKGRFLVLLDDDNTVGADFIVTLLAAMARDAQIGAVVPQVEPVWEQTPAEWIIDYGRQCLSYNAAGQYRSEYSRDFWPAGTVEMSIRPPGGGMIIRSDVAARYLSGVLDERRINLSRQPKSLVGCEDHDIFRGVLELGLAAVIEPRLRVYHHIPESRTRIKYLIRLNAQMAYSYGALHCFLKPDTTFVIVDEIKELARVAIDYGKGVVRKRIPASRALVEFSRAAGDSLGRFRFAKERTLK